jgi:hypothetical protein
MHPLIISNTAVRQDAEGRFCLNDLHRAAVQNGKATESHRPGSFMRLPSTKALILAAQKRCTNTCISQVSTVRGGPVAARGTFVSKPLVYAYAMWIDADFNLDVIEAFDSMQVNAMSLYRQLQAVVAEEVETQIKASFGSHLMLERKRAIPEFRRRRETLEAQIQPSLQLH